MTNETMNLQELLEKTTDADFLREMIGFTAQRLMDVEVEGVSGSGDGEGNASDNAAQDAAPEAEIKLQRRRRTRGRMPDADR